MLYIVLTLIIWLFPIFIPFNESFFRSLNLKYFLPYEAFVMIYIFGIILLTILISYLVKRKKFNNDYLFFFSTLWIFNILTFIYFSCFESIFWSLIFSFLEIINLLILFVKIKKINKGLTKYLFLFFAIYIYLFFLIQ